MTAKTRAIPSLHRDKFLAKVTGHCSVRRRVPQPPHIAGPLGLKCSAHEINSISMTPFKKYYFILLIFLVSFNLQAQLKIKILRSPHSIEASRDSISVKVKFINFSDKDYLLFYTKTALPYKNPREFYLDNWSPPTSLVVITNSQKIESEPKFKFEYLQVEFLDFEEQKKFHEEQSKTIRFHESLIKSRIKAAEANPILIPANSHKVIVYNILTKEIQLSPGFHKIKIGYCCENIFRFERTSIDNIKSQYKNSEIYIGTVFSKEKPITIKEKK